MSQADAAARAALDRLTFGIAAPFNRAECTVVRDYLTALEAKVERLSKGWNNTAVKHNDLLA